MLIGVMSDTHGDLRRLPWCTIHLKEVDLLLHAGDFFEDSEKIGRILGVKTVGVIGNCDYMVKGPSEELLTLDNKKVYITHGHLYGVKTEITPLIERAKVLGADVAVYGHTHVSTIFRKDGVLFVNPGCLHRPPHRRKASFALLEILPNRVEARLVEVPV